MTVCWLGVRDPGFAGWLAHWGYVAGYVDISGRESGTYGHVPSFGALEISWPPTRHRLAHAAQLRRARPADGRAAAEQQPRAAAEQHPGFGGVGRRRAVGGDHRSCD